MPNTLEEILKEFEEYQAEAFANILNDSKLTVDVTASSIPFALQASRDWLRTRLTSYGEAQYQKGVEDSVKALNAGRFCCRYQTIDRKDFFDNCLSVTTPKEE